MTLPTAPKRTVPEPEPVWSRVRVRISSVRLMMARASGSSAWPVRVGSTCRP